MKKKSFIKKALIMIHVLIIVWFIILADDFSEYDDQPEDRVGKNIFNIKFGAVKSINACLGLKNGFSDFSVQHLIFASILF